MKKSVVILIAIIYIAAIFLVSFFGLDFKVFNEFVYVDSIQILNDDLTVNQETGTKYTVITPDENGRWRYQIDYRVGPDNATNQEVDFVYDKNSTVASVDSNGVVTFFGVGGISIYLMSKDGNNIKSETITIYAVEGF